MERSKLVGPLQSEEKLKKLEEEYTIILYKIIRHIIKELGQSAERQTIPFNYYDHWRKYSTRISIPKKEAIEIGYGNDKFIEVRRAVNSKFHIFEEYEAEKDGVEQIIFLIEPKFWNLISQVKTVKLIFIMKQYRKKLRNTFENFRKMNTTIFVSKFALTK